jgi:plastocyanin
MRGIGPALVLLVAAVGGCGDSDPSPPTAADLAEADLSPDHTITVDEDGYEPDDLRAASGSVVLLVNEGDQPHSFTEEEGAFDTGRMEPGDETTLVLTDPGTYELHDVEDPDVTVRLEIYTP